MEHEAWLASGERVRVELPGSGIVEIFCRVAGSGSWLTLLHGFPTSSWDWARVAPALEGRFRVLAFDFLGFGDSDKPRRHRYSILEQADLAEAVWRSLGVEETGLVGHDYGATVAQDLLARRRERRLGVRLSAVVLLNSGLYVDLARPLLVQRLLARRVLGPLLARTLTERIFARSLASVFAKAHPIGSSDLRAQWRVVRRRGGVAVTPGLLGYMTERRRYAARWEGALEATDVPLHLVWGMADQRSGAHIAEHVRRRVPHARLVALAGVGHYPQLEVPDVVAGEIAAAF